MTNYKAALVRPLTNWRFLLGAVVGGIPLLNLFVLGYALRCCRWEDNNYTLPPVKPLGALVVDTVVMTLTFLVMNLVNGLLMLLAVSVAQATSQIVGIIDAIITFAVILVIIYCMPLPPLLWVKTGSFAHAFSPRLILRTAFTRRYFLASLVGWLWWFLLIFVSMIIGGLLSFTIIAPFLFLGASLFAGSVTLMTLLGEQV